jgi:hypothetical protein
MGLSDSFLPQRLPRQVVFAGDRHAETFLLRRGRITGRSVSAGPALAEGDGWEAALAALRPESTGVVFNASPFIFNFFEFDKLPWQRQALRELVDWRLQKIFPEDSAAYDHRLFRLDRKRVLSILVRRSLLERVEAAFAGKKIPLTYIGSSTMEILARARRAKPAPDFFIERDGAGCTLAFLERRRPVYIRKFRNVSTADTVSEIGKTVAFVRNQYGIAPRRYWLHDHLGDESAMAVEAALQAVPAEETAGSGEYSRLPLGPDAAPHIPGCS